MQCNGRAFGGISKVFTAGHAAGALFTYMSTVVKWAAFYVTTWLGGEGEKWGNLSAMRDILSMSHCINISLLAHTLENQ